MVPTKRGYDYVWESFKDVVVFGLSRTVVDEAHTEQGYKLAHFGSVFGWNIYKG